MNAGNRPSTSGMSTKITPSRTTTTPSSKKDCTASVMATAHNPPEKVYMSTSVAITSMVRMMAVSEPGKRTGPTILPRDAMCWMGQ